MGYSDFEYEVKLLELENRIKELLEPETIINVVMAMLRIPDNYATERGGWKNDKVMKKVYTHTFSEERQKVDGVINDYFKKILNINSANIDIQKYKAWLILYEKPDTKESVNEFKEFMQHEMQHK